MAHTPCSTHCHMLERWKKLNKNYSTSSSRYSQGNRCLIFNKRKLKVFQYLETFSGSQFCYFAIRGRQFTSVCDVTFLRGIYRVGTSQLPPRHHSPPPRRVAAGSGAWAETGRLTSAILGCPAPTISWCYDPIRGDASHLLSVSLAAETGQVDNE